MKFSYLLIAFFFLILNGCSDFSSDSNEFEHSGKFYACDGDRYGEIIDDSKLGKKQYCNGYRWIDLVPEDSIVTIRPESKDSTVGDLSESKDSSQIMYECNNGSIVINKNLCSENPKEYLPLDDSEYPYAGIPRIVIETENRREIRDRETEIPAKLQIWGESAPESEIMELTIKGRGNSSWTDMPKKSYKIEFLKKQEMLGMPKDKDWALIANYADKTLMKNFISYKLSRDLGMYAPRCEYAELFVNKQYQGTYLVTETIKNGPNRVNTSNNNTSYIVEFDAKYRHDEIVIFSKILNTRGKAFQVHFPKNATQVALDTLLNHIQNFERFLTTITSETQLDEIKQWLDVEYFTKHYWIQEITKNPDARYHTSVFFSWTKNETIKPGPVWDFDLAYGGHYNDSTATPEMLYIRPAYWNSYLFKSRELKNYVDLYYEKEITQFLNILNYIDSLKLALEAPAKNNFKRWNILHNEGKWISRAVSDYNEAVNNLKTWLSERFVQIDSLISF